MVFHAFYFPLLVLPWLCCVALLRVAWFLHETLSFAKMFLLGSIHEAGRSKLCCSSVLDWVFLHRCLFIFFYYFVKNGFELFSVSSFTLFCLVPLVLPTPSVALLCSWLIRPYTVFFGATLIPISSWLFMQRVTKSPVPLLPPPLIGRRQYPFSQWPITQNSWSLIWLHSHHHLCHFPSSTTLYFGNLT